MPLARRNIVLIIATCITAAVLLAVFTIFFISRTYLIGYINPNRTEFEGAQGFLRNMPKFGFMEGKNTTYIRCESKDKAEIEKNLKEMVARKVDLIMTMTTPATKMAKAITRGTDIPAFGIPFRFHLTPKESKKLMLQRAAEPQKKSGDQHPRILSAIVSVSAA